MSMTHRARKENLHGSFSNAEFHYSIYKTQLLATSTKTADKSLLLVNKRIRCFSKATCCLLN